MARPCKKHPKRNVVSFRLTDPEFAALQYLAQQAAKPGETFNDTIARYIKNAIKAGAEKQYVETKLSLDMNGVKVSFTKEDFDRRRWQYREHINELREKTRKAYDAAAQGVPERLEMVGLASPSVVAVARPEAAAHDTTGAGQSDQKNTDFSTDRNFPARENCLQENS